MVANANAQPLTKQDFLDAMPGILASFATKQDLTDAVAGFATKDDLKKEIGGVVEAIQDLTEHIDARFNRLEKDVAIPKGRH